MTGPRRSARWMLLLVAVLTAGAPAPLADTEILVAAGDKAEFTLAPGDALSVPVLVRQRGDRVALAGLDLSVEWDARLLRFVDVETGDFGSLFINTRGVLEGILSVSLFAGRGTTEDFRVLTLELVATEETGSTEVLPRVVAARTESGGSVSDRTRARVLPVCVAELRGVAGDVNGDDRANVVDAQLIARFAAGLAVADPAGVEARGDVNGDGAVDVLDAQAVARFAAGLEEGSRAGERILGTCEGDGG